MRVIFTAGVFDLLHEGHLNILRASKALGDLLIVGVVTDQGTAAYKGRIPVHPEHVRLDLVRSLRFVDGAFLQPGTDPSPVLSSLAACGLCPEVMTHGDDWTELREGNETLAQLGIRLELLPYTRGISTTLTRRQIDADRPTGAPFATIDEALG